MGWPFDPPVPRIERLAESLEIIERLFGGEEVNFEGGHYQVRRLRGLPRAIQQPRPPLLVGGGGRRILELAARTADIVAVHATLSGAPWRLMQSRISARIRSRGRWTGSAPRCSAGRPADSVELQFSVYLCQIGGAERAQVDALSTFADRLAVDPELVANSPSVLIGSVDDCADLLEERRERYGFSYLRLSDEIDTVAPWFDASQAAERAAELARVSERELPVATRQYRSAARSPLMKDSSVQAWSQSP